MIRVGVSGLTGMIGRNIITQYVRDPELAQLLKPFAFTRRASDTSFLAHNGIEYHRIDYEDPASFSGKVEDLDAFLHLAGLTKAITPAEYYRANVDGTARLLDALSRYGKQIKHFIFVSSTSACGPSPAPDRPKTEEDPCLPISHYGKSKLKAEELIRSSSLNWTIFRFPVVFGPYDLDMLYLYRIAKSGVITMFSGLQDPYSYVSSPDVGRFLLQAVLNERLFRDTYFYCYDSPLHLGELFSMIRKRLGLPSNYRYLQVPKWVAHPARAILALRQRLLGRATIVNPDKFLELATAYWFFSNKKLKDALGMETIKDNRAVAETLKWYQEHQLL